MPILLLLIYSVEYRKCLYKIFLPIAYFIICFFIAHGKVVTVNKKKVGVRYKYRYLFMILLSFVFNIVYSLLDFYYWGEDYLSDIIAVTSLYTLICLPAAITRTYYSRGLDLLDSFYSKEDDYGIRFVFALIAGFYAIMFGYLWIVSELGITRILFSSSVADYWSFFMITVIEIIIFILFYWAYIAFKKKRGEYIYYK